MSTSIRSVIEKNVSLFQKRNFIISVSILLISYFLFVATIMTYFQTSISRYVLYKTKQLDIEGGNLFLQKEFDSFFKSFEGSILFKSRVAIFLDNQIIAQSGNDANILIMYEQVKSITSQGGRNFLIKIKYDLTAILFFLLITLCIYSIFFYLLNRKSIQKIFYSLKESVVEIEQCAKSILELKNQLNNVKNLPSNMINYTYNLNETIEINNAVLELTEEIIAARAKVERLAFYEAISLVASQVAHDIRSPLSALNVVTSVLTEVPEDKRIVIRNATQRINDIANDLLSKGRQAKASADLSQASNISTEFRGKKSNSASAMATAHTSSQASAQISMDTTLLPTLIDSIISEKRIQYRDKASVQIDADINSAYGIFVTINPNEFSRLLSNLINNSVEALINSFGKVTVSIRKYGASVSIIIQDNGKGIAEEVLSKLGKRGVTHGKDGSESSGSGLGIWHAKTTIESYNGKFQILSKIDQGTQVILTLPISNTPSWFQESLLLTQNQKIVALDDDMSIHGIWKGRLHSLKANEYHIEFYNFTSSSEFKNYVSTLNLETSENTRAIFLIDYELLNQPQTGLDIIEELNIHKKQNFVVVLVTSRFEENYVRTRCETLGIKLIPKNLASFIPMTIEST